MKIGILTHHYVNNYGAYWQGLCLCQAVQQLYPHAEVRIIDFVNTKHWCINAGGFFRYSPQKETLSSWLDKIRMPHLFSKARKDNMPLTHRIYSAQALTKLGLDVIIVGSDEVWNYEDPKSFLPIKFGVRMPVGIRCFSYAASVGGVTDFSQVPEILSKGLSRFERIAVRDDNTERFVQQCLDIAPTRVLDPVFLMPPTPCDSPRIQALSEKSYLLFYHCAPLSPTERSALHAYAKEKNYALYGAGEFDKLYDPLPQTLTPLEWASLFAHAHYVITGTFHGAVFSLINKRNLLVCPDNPTRAQKIASLLQECNLSDRIICPNTLTQSLSSMSPINYETITPSISALQEKSLAYLQGLCPMTP